MRFPDWIRLVVTRRRQLAAELTAEELADRWRAAIERGLAESLAAGTMLVGEIASQPWAGSLLSAKSLSGLIFQELIGLKREAAEGQRELAERELATPTGDSWSRGLSPHAPYTVHPELLQQVATLSREQRFPLAMHLAESPEELELLASQTGPFRELLEQFGSWQEGVLRPDGRPLDYLQVLAEADSALVIHGNYLSPEERQFLAAHRDRLTLVYCPRTHAYFGHDPYPLTDLLRAGVAVAIGTDSRASNPDLSLLAELKFVARTHPQVDPGEVLRLGTLAGAQALRQADRTGSLVPGKRADLAIVAIDPTARDPYAAVLADESRVIKP
jgi:cytosine/adenosine deaminase-related metal-dependent hydrolase